MGADTLLVELGTEELPPRALRDLGLAFRDGIVAGLAQRGLDHGDVRWFATPRRLAVLIAGAQPQAPEKNIEVLGPPLERARDEAGEWTAAARGFAGKQGVQPDELQVIDTPKGPRLGLGTTLPGCKLHDELNAIIRESIQGLPVAKRMRWGASREEFVRPVHWIVAMFGGRSDYGKIFGLETGNATRGHRFHSAGPIVLGHPDEYEGALADARVVACFEKRRQRIRAAVDAQAQRLGATAVIDDDLLDEVTGLVEWPVALAGAFDERFLEVPPEALVSSMKVHQKYFHVVDETGGLRPHFITVANLESTDPAQVVAGNERVIRPRLADAAFFFATDSKTPLVERVPNLDNIVFQQQLGTLLDKTTRVSRLAGALAGRIGAPPDLAERAGLLSRADLVTDMVLEFPDMQGIAGSYYARGDGEHPEVAEALAQQYWPKFSGDRLPDTLTACALGLADRLDTLVGIFGIGQAPTGSRDPFALRRASLAVLRTIVEKELDLDLGSCLEQAASLYPPGVIAPGTAGQVLEYMIERFRAWYEEDGIPVEVFRSVGAKRLTQPLDIHRRVLAVHAFASLPQAQALAAANKRVANILAALDSGHAFGEVSTNLLSAPQEKALADQLLALGAASREHLRDREYTAALGCLAALREPVDAFFDDVMVNVDDPALRDNRLNLLKQLRDLFLEVADISQLAVAR